VKKQGNTLKEFREGKAKKENKRLSYQLVRRARRRFTLVGSLCFSISAAKSIHQKQIMH
jgi:hypothetical protein